MNFEGNEWVDNSIKEHKEQVEDFIDIWSKAIRRLEHDYMEEFRQRHHHGSVLTWIALSGIDDEIEFTVPADVVDKFQGEEKTIKVKLNTTLKPLDNGSLRVHVDIVREPRESLEEDNEQSSD